DGNPVPDCARQASQRNGDVRAAEDEELRGSRKRLQEGTVPAYRVLPVEEVGDARVRRRQQCTRARRLTDVRLQDDRMLGLQGGHEVAMRLREWLDEHVDFATTAQADRPGEVVADAVVKE